MLEVLKHYIGQQPEHFSEVVDTNKLNGLFSFREKDVFLTDNNLQFINMVNDIVPYSLTKQTNTNIFYFDIDYATLEINCFINFNTRHIAVYPRIYYDNETIQENLQRIIHREFLIYSFFKRWELQ